MRLGTLSATPAVAVMANADPLVIGPITDFNASTTGGDTSIGSSLASGVSAPVAFSQMTASEQAAFLDAQAQAQTGTSFADMTAAQQAAFEASLGLGTNPTGDSTSFDTVAAYLGIGLLGLIVISHLTQGGR